MTPTPPDDVDAEPEDPTERIIRRLDRLIDGVDRGRAAVTTERRWRRLSFILIAIVILGTTYGLHRDAIRQQHTAAVETEARQHADDALCRDRRKRATDNIDLAYRVAYREARFYNRPPSEAAQLGKVVAATVAGILPPPTCPTRH